ncbi:MAG: XylR family transcriptional regulator [Planctomycetaceae bacterium]
MAKPPRVMLIVETSLAYGRAVLKGISRYMVARQQWSLYLDLRELIVSPPVWLDDWQGDGIICRSTTPELARRFDQRGIPVVDLTDIHGDLGLPHIWTENMAVGQLGAAHLLERGFRHLAFCGFSGHDWSDRRKVGFMQALGQASVTAHQFLSPWDNGNKQLWDDSQQALATWLERLPKPVGIMACNDLRGHHVLDACRRLQLAVPEEVAVLGVDNDDLLCELCHPPLSSIVLNAERVGYEAAAMLDTLMQGKAPANREQLIQPLGVVTRQSTDVLAINDPHVATAVKFIRDHACDGIAVDEILKSVPLSRSVLERRFRKYLGRSPQEEIRHVQLKRVRQLLAETDLTLERIATLAGFDHAEYMSVVFKREIGQTPGQFRRQTQPGKTTTDL